MIKWVMHSCIVLVLFVFFSAPLVDAADSGLRGRSFLAKKALLLPLDEIGGSASKINSLMKGQDASVIREQSEGHENVFRTRILNQAHSRVARPQRQLEGSSPDLSWLWALLGSLGFLAIMWLLLRQLRKYNERKSEEASPPPTEEEAEEENSQAEENPHQEVEVKSQQDAEEKFQNDQENDSGGDKKDETGTNGVNESET